MAAKKTTTAKPSKKTTKPKEERGPGVIASLVEFLQGASKEKPLTKDQLLARLVKRFPDRTAEAMLKTVHCQIPSRLSKEKGINIQSVDTDAGKGFYIK